MLSPGGAGLAAVEEGIGRGDERLAVRRQLFSASTGKHYRRGAIMGLTVAEAFMLIAFVLLLLLLFWRHQVQDAVNLAAKLPPESQQALLEGAVPIRPERLAELETKEQQLANTARRVLAEDEVAVTRQRLEDLKATEQLLEKPLQRALAEFAAKLPPETLRKLTDLARKPDTVAAADALLKGAVTIRPERLAELEAKEQQLANTERRVLMEDEVPVARQRLEELRETERLLEKPLRRALAELAAKLPPETLRKLTDLAREPDIVTAANALLEGAVPIRPERLAELEAKERLTAGRNAADITEALELRSALDPYGEDSNKVLLDRVRNLQAKENAVDSRLAEEAQARQKFMGKLRSELSDVVRRAGGKIGPRGRITFPDKAFFEKGSAEITGRSREFLDEICSRWLATLKSSSDRFDIDEIRIEGHSSSEWARARTERQKWIGNLGLSQQRAQSVLVHCLDRGPKALGNWARGKLTAVGYSSSRRIAADDGSEDKEASRRIELGYEVSRERLISDLGGAAATEGGKIRPISGNALVTDADTIKIGKAVIRLDGIDAPERGQTCIGVDESEWPCGREARSALERRISGRPVVCERLVPGLARFRGRCRVVGESEELNRWAVQQGWAFAYVKFSKDYARDEAAARKARRGIWSGRAPVPPWEWRRKRPSATIR